MKIIKQGILLFWAMWFFIVFLTNFLDIMKTIHFLPDTWLFSSGNWSVIQEVTSIYNTPLWLTRALFFLILFGEISVVFSFLRAYWAVLYKKSNALSTVNLAFGVGLAFWAIFLIGDEIFVAYTVETNHQNLANLMLLSALLFYYSPNQMMLEK